MKVVLVVGHRGSKATHPENTIAAFEYAIRIGADAVELDVVVTTDGVLAVQHDEVNCAFSDLPPHVPRLEQVLELAARSSIVFDIEAKACGVAHDRYAQMLADLLPTERIMVRSFEHNILREVHALKPRIPLAALTKEDTYGWVEICRHAKAEWISPWHELVSSAETELAHEAGLRVMPWTVNHQGDWADQIRMGVDAMITDDPAALRRFLTVWEESEYSNPARSASAPGAPFGASAES